MCDRLLWLTLEAFCHCGVKIGDIKHALYEFTVAVEYECCR